MRHGNGHGQSGCKIAPRESTTRCWSGDCGDCSQMFRARPLSSLAPQPFDARKMHNFCDSRFPETLHSHQILYRDIGDILGAARSNQSPRSWRHPSRRHHRRRCSPMERIRCQQAVSHRISSDFDFELRLDSLDDPFFCQEIKLKHI